MSRLQDSRKLTSTMAPGTTWLIPVLYAMSVENGRTILLLADRVFSPCLKEVKEPYHGHLLQLQGKNLHEGRWNGQHSRQSCVKGLPHFARPLLCCHGNLALTLLRCDGWMLFMICIYLPTHLCNSQKNSRPGIAQVFSIIFCFGMGAFHFSF